MGKIREFEDLLKIKQDLEARRPNLLRIKRLLDEKREKGIIPKKVSKMPDLQEIERQGYERIFDNQA